MAIGLSVLRLLLFERIESVNELREATKLPVSGGVPAYKDITKEEYVLVGSKSPRHPTTEAFRGLRTNLQYLLNKEGQNTILVSSMHPGEGKTFTATNMAALLAQAGKKTLLIDYDLHKPRVHRALNVDRGTGLSGYLIGQVPWEQAVQPTDISGLDVVTSGPVPPNASELVLNDRTDQLIAEARKVYDFVVIDTPPILLITDALVLMKHVDRALLVANVKRANARGMRQLENLLEQNSLVHVSMVLNASAHGGGISPPSTHTATSTVTAMGTAGTEATRATEGTATETSATATKTKTDPACAASRASTAMRTERRGPPRTE